jgi:hypothetical protein
MAIKEIAPLVGRNVSVTLKDGSKRAGELRGLRIAGLYNVVTWQSRSGTIIKETGPQPDVWATDIVSITEL